MARLESRIPELIAKSPEAAARALMGTAKEVFDISQVLVPVDTGDLKASGDIDQVSLQQVNVGYGTDHSKFPELGVASKNYPQQPYLMPALLQSPKILEGKVKDEYEKQI